MPEKSIDTSEFEKLIGNLERIPDRAIPIFTAAMHEATQIALGEVVDRTPVAYGNLRGSITTLVKASEYGVVGVVGTNAPYALWVEEDTEPHWAPLQPLLDWVRKKQIVGVYSIKSRRRMGSKTSIEAENLAFAKLVQKKIAMKGTTGQHMFRDGFAAAEADVDRIFSDAINDVVALLNGGPI